VRADAQISSSRNRQAGYGFLVAACSHGTWSPDNYPGAGPLFHSREPACWQELRVAFLRRERRCLGRTRAWRKQHLRMLRAWRHLYLSASGVASATPTATRRCGCAGEAHWRNNITFSAFPPCDAGRTLAAFAWPALRRGGRNMAGGVARSSGGRIPLLHASIFARAKSGNAGERARDVLRAGDSGLGGVKADASRQQAYLRRAWRWADWRGRDKRRPCTVLFSSNASSLRFFQADVEHGAVALPL